MLYSIFINRSTFWELPRQTGKIGKKKSETHLSKKSCYISSSVLHNNWGSKNTRFDNLEKKIKNKSMILKK
jgi:hypothetical protein